MEKLKHKYIFPNIMANMMKNIDMKTQLEASMMSMFLLLAGMMLMSIYTFLYLTQGMVFKILLVFNLLAGFIFMSSFLVTTYQQYLSFMDAISLQNTVNLNPLSSNQVNNVPRKKNRVNQLLFFGGLLIIVIGAILLYFPEIRTKNWIIITAAMIFGFVMVISVFFRKNKNNAVKDKVNDTFLGVARVEQTTDEMRLKKIRDLSRLLKIKVDEHKRIVSERESKHIVNKYINPDEEEFYR
jgi:glucan phosphoethanolaminetransferase (alkaline phosphatase superfamily)